MSGHERANLSIREHRLPGLGRRYDVDMANGRVLSVIAHRHGGFELAVSDAGADEPRDAVSLTHDQAVAVGTLLGGIRFVGEDEGTSVEVATVTLGPASPALGRTAADVPLPAGCDDAAVLAVIRDDTPELLEDHARPYRVGDRLVVAARPDVADEVARHLAG